MKSTLGYPATELEPHEDSRDELTPVTSEDVQRRRVRRAATQAWHCVLGCQIDD